MNTKDQFKTAYAAQRAMDSGVEGADRLRRNAYAKCGWAAANAARNSIALRNRITDDSTPAQRLQAKRELNSFFSAK